MKSLLDINLHTTADQIRKAVAAGADPNARDDRGITPLHYACFNNIDIQPLLDAGADPNARRGVGGETPLYLALPHDNLGNLQNLLAAGADPNVFNDRGYTPLHLALNAHQTKALLAAGADPNTNARDAEGATPLHYAHDAEQTKALLDAGADVNARDKRGKTPLHGASSNGSRLLLDAGADPNASRDDGVVPLHYACDAEQTKALLAAGADPNASANGLTPLHEAHSVEQARALLDAGAQVPAYLTDRVRGLVNHVQMEREATVEQPKESTMTMKSLLDINENTTADEIREAVAAGANPNEAYVLEDYHRDSEGYSWDVVADTPLLRAYNAEQTRALLAAGADPNMGNDASGETPLHMAHDAEQSRALLDAGAKVPDDLNEKATGFVEQAQMEREKERMETNDMLKAVFKRDMSPEGIQDRITAFYAQDAEYQRAMLPLNLRETAKAQDDYERAHTHPNQFGGEAVKTAQTEESPADKLRDLRQTREDNLRVLREDAGFLHDVVNKHADYKIVNSLLNASGSVHETEEQAERAESWRLSRVDGQVKKLLEDTAPSKPERSEPKHEKSSSSHSDSEDGGSAAGGKPRLAKSLAAATGR